MKKVWAYLKAKKWFILIILAVLVVGGGYFYRKQTTKPVIQTTTPEVRDIIESLDVSGNIDAHESATLRFAAASKLTWLPIKEGDTVKKWQSIAAVDSAQMQKQMAIDQNLHGIQFRSTEQVLDNNNVYGAQGLTETQRRSVESSQLQLRNTALGVEMQDIAIRNSTMVSPINGLITKIDQPNVGAVTMPTDTIQVVNPSTVFFNVIVDEADIGKVNVGQEATIVLDAFSDQTLNAKVEKIAFTPTPSQNGGLGYQVNLSLPVDNTLQQYRMGMSGDAYIVLSKKAQVLSIPTDAITQRNGVDTVEVVRNGKMEKVEVKTGISDGNFTEITSGLTSQDVVVVPTKTGS
jgi:HlyD family secretion protein